MNGWLEERAAQWLVDAQTEGWHLNKARLIGEAEHLIGQLLNEAGYPDYRPNPIQDLSDADFDAYLARKVV